MNDRLQTLTKRAKDLGFRVFIAERGNYGFYTDTNGKSLVSFGVEFGGVNLSGNYKPHQEDARSVGQGWRIGEYETEISEGDVLQAFEAHTPHWVGNKRALPLKTLDQYMSEYNKSSRFEEI